MRTIAIGDVHGCSLALAAMIEVLAPKPDDELIFLGDYVDRGPSSRDVLQKMIELSAHCRLIPLLGNHELLFLAACQESEATPFWIEQCGGDETLISYG